MSCRRRLKNVHVFAGDIHGGRWSPDAENVQSFCVVGTIVSVVMSPFSDDGELIDIHCKRPIVYEVDDGTGLVRVVHFVAKKKLKTPESGNAKNLADSASFVEKSKALEALMHGHFPVSTCVEAKGSLQYYSGQKELRAFSVRQLTSAQAEVDRTLRTAELRNNRVYDRILGEKNE